MWNVSLQKPALKNVARAPKHERERLFAAIEEMREDPKCGNVRALHNEQDWRIFFDLYPDRHLVVVVAIQRRTTTTYRKR